MWFEFTIPKPPVPLPTLSCSSLHGSHRGCPIPEYCTSIKHSNRAISIIPGAMCTQKVISALPWVQPLALSRRTECHSVSKVSLKFTQWLCRNTSEGNAQCSPHPLIFLLCRMQIHNLEGKTMATPEIFPILAGLGQLAKVTYSKGHENYTHDTNVQWNIFKFRWNQVCNPSDAAALDNFSPFFSFLTFFSNFLRKTSHKQDWVPRVKLMFFQCRLTGHAGRNSFMWFKHKTIFAFLFCYGSLPQGNTRVQKGEQGQREDLETQQC